MVAFQCVSETPLLQKKSREESSGAGSGVEIIKNEPYTDGPGGNGQYTLKIYHIGSHMPGEKYHTPRVTDSVASPSTDNLCHYPSSVITQFPSS